MIQWGAYIYAKESFIDSLSRYKSHSLYAAKIAGSLHSKTKQEIQDIVILHLAQFLKKHNWPKIRSTSWVKAENEMQDTYFTKFKKM